MNFSNKTKLLYKIIDRFVSLAGFALKCKRCDDNECKTATDETCTPAPAGSKAVCLTEIAKMDNKEVVQKKCVNQKDTGKYECITVPGQTIVSCTTCDKDLCNSAPKFTLASMGALLLVLVIPRFL